MGRGIYDCTKCKKTFPRRYNAEHHNKLIHDEMAIVFNKDTGWRSDMTKEIKTQSSSFPSSSISSSKSPTDATKHNDTIPSSRVPYPNNLEELHVGIPDPEINIKTDDENFIEIFEKISPLIEDLDNLLSTYKSPDEKIKMVSEGIILALMSSNPVSSLKDIINLHRLNRGITKAVAFTAKSKNITLEQAQSMLKAMVFTAPYSKNENKFNK
jgi:hypothetical protein